VLVGFCPESMRLLNSDLDAKLRRWELEDIPEVKKYKTVITRKKFTGLFDFHEAEGGGYTFERNPAKVAAARRRFGYFCIFTTDPDASAKELVDTYRDKDGVEKQFMELKRYMDARRPRVHSQKAFDGKYDLLMISLILRRWLRDRLGAYMEAKKMNLKRCLMKLSDVRMYVDDREVRLEKAITKEQRELLALCGVDPLKLEDSMRESILSA